MQRPLTFFLNGAARKVSTVRLAPKLEQWAQANGIDARFLSPALPDLPDAVAKTIAENRVPVAVGGDGTVHQLAQHLPEGATFATLPQGSGNDFATALGWSASLDRALEQLRTAEPAPVDAISVTQAGEQAFAALSIAGWGFACDVNREANASSVPGPLQYPVGVFQALTKGGTRAVRLTFDDGRVIEDRFWTVLVCNTAAAGGGMKFSPDTDPQDGSLEVLALGDVSTLGLVGLLGRVYVGRHLSHPQVNLWHCRSVQLEPLEEAAGAWSAVQAEGDMYPGAAATTFSVLPAHLSVLVPRDAPLNR